MILYLVASKGKNVELADKLFEIGQKLGGEHEVLNLCDENLPLYVTGAEKKESPENLPALVAKMQKAKAFVFVAPEYNGGIPPVLSNTVAWVSVSGGDDWRAAFNGKFAAIATHSGGPAAKLGRALRLQFNHIGTTILAREINTSYSKALNEDSAEDVLNQLLKTA
jgi:NAD(P)H-dependent FMN reductase